MRGITVIETGENTELPGIIDAYAKSIAEKAKNYFGIDISHSRTTKVYTIQGKLAKKETSLILEKIFQKPTKKVAVNGSFTVDFEIAIWWGPKLGVKDTEGEVAKEAIEEILGRKIGNVYTSQVLYLEKLSLLGEPEKLISLLANPNVERWKVIPRKKWNVKTGIGPRTSEVKIKRKPQFRFLNLNISNEEFEVLDGKNNWALGTKDFRFLKEYFYGNEEFRRIREELGLKNMTDVEIECLAQTWSDHCSHRTFHGRYQYTDPWTRKTYTIDDPFRVFIKAPTEAIAKVNPWVVSVLSDNAGVMFLDSVGENVVGIKIETHNSPSWLDPYGGAITGIVGVKRDPLGTGRWGLKLIAGLCRFSTASRDYIGTLIPEIHPLQIHDGIIAGIRDGGNKHGVPTIRHSTFFDDSYIGKGHVFAGAIGISPRFIEGKTFEDKTANPGDLVVVFGGRTGIDGIHGVTEASMGFSEKITMGHVQKGDPYLQRKVSELIEEARRLEIFNLIWDLGGGGISSSITETAKFSNGIKIDLQKVLLKYQGLDWWQILVSESQERMIGAIPPEKIDQFLELAKLHDVEVTVIGVYTDSGAVHIMAEGKTAAYLPLKLLHDDPPQWQFSAIWTPPESRLFEPSISEPIDYNTLLQTILNHKNVCSTKWVLQQFDFRVKGQSVIPPLIEEGIEGPASVIRPILDKNEGIAISDSANPRQSIIDPYWMTMNALDRSLRCVVSVAGMKFNDGKPERVGLLDNFCWPGINPGPDNPDAEYKAAQLIRSLAALRKFVQKFEAPLLSGKDSMYIDAWVKGRFGQKHRVSGLPCFQGTVIASIDDVGKCLTPTFKRAKDDICIVGLTKNELGASIYYQILGYVGLNIPKTDIDESIRNVKAISEAIDAEILTGVQPVIEAGLALSLSKMAIGGQLGAEIDLEKMPLLGVKKNSQALFSETGGRFVITFNPRNRKQVEKLLTQHGCQHAVVGMVTEEKSLKVTGLEGKKIIDISISDIQTAYTKRFGDLV